MEVDVVLGQNQSGTRKRAAASWGVSAHTRHTVIGRYRAEIAEVGLIFESILPIISLNSVKYLQICQIEKSVNFNVSV